ncbi:transposase family protein [Actinomadura montaniterrae]|uniref:transposase family protein n=1 Tax=Actinomadura montaniterrae TaxID=1803903 RepID=UPI001CEF6C4B|nr:transposase family protein [Actinomadura montaniterrae]
MRPSTCGTPANPHEHGGNIQALFAPNGFPLWLSHVEPGSVHDLTAAREHVLGACTPLPLRTTCRPWPQRCRPGRIYTPAKQPADGQALDIDTRSYNMLLRALRCLGERGFALLTQRWRTLQHITASRRKIGNIAKAASCSSTPKHGHLT